MASSCKPFRTDTPVDLVANTIWQRPYLLEHDEIHPSSPRGIVALESTISSNELK
jgi:hypothetical protein